MAVVTSLTYYPIKGCAGITVPEAAMTAAGLAHDRSFMITNAEGGFRSQRRDPGMAVIRPTISADGNRLSLSAPGATEVDVKVDASSPPVPVEMFGDPYRGIDQGPEAAQWLSDVLGVPSRLVRVPADHDRVTGGLNAGTAGFADGCAVLIASQSSLDELNRRLPADEARLPMSRFRPNIVVEGWPEPHTEDRAREVAIGGARLGYAKLAVRCVVTTVDQASGAKVGPEPLRTLADYRRLRDAGVCFGAKFAVTRTGNLRVGDEVRVDTWGDSPI